MAIAIAYFALGVVCSAADCVAAVSRDWLLDPVWALLLFNAARRSSFDLK